MSPLVSVHRSTAVPLGSVPNGSTVVFGALALLPVAPAGDAAALLTSRPAPSAATIDERRRRAAGETARAPAVEEWGDEEAGCPSMGTPMSVAIHRRRRAVAGAPSNPRPGTTYGAVRPGGPRTPCDRREAAGGVAITSPARPTSALASSPERSVGRPGRDRATAPAWGFHDHAGAGWARFFPDPDPSNTI